MTKTTQQNNITRVKCFDLKRLRAGSEMHCSIAKAKSMEITIHIFAKK